MTSLQRMSHIVKDHFQLTLNDINNISNRIFIHYICKLIGYLSSIVMLMIMYFSNTSRLYFSIIPLFFSNLYLFIYTLIYQIKSDNQHLIFLVFELFFDMIFIITVFLIFIMGSTKLYAFIPSTLHMILNFILLKERKSLFFPQILILNLNYYISLFFMSLNIEKKVEWPPLVSMIPNFIFFLVLLILSFFNFKDLYVSGLKLVQCEISVNEFISLNILFISVYHFIITQLFSMLFFSKSNFSIDITNFKSENLIVFILTIYYFCVQIYLTTVSRINVRKIIENYLRRNFSIIGNEDQRISTENDVIDVINNLNVENPLANRIQTPSNINQGHKLKLKNTDLKVIISKYFKNKVPKQLIQKNSCFFVRSDQIDIKKKPNEIIKNEEESKTNNALKFESNLSLNLKKPISKHSSLKLNEQSKDSEMNILVKCMICCDKESNSVLMDCGHGGLCYECSLKLWKTGDDCHICRKKIKEVLQISLDEKGHGKFSIISATFSMDKDYMNFMKKECFKLKRNKNLKNREISENDEELNISIIDI